MKAVICSIAAVLAVATFASAASQRSDIDIEGADGVMLKATYTSPGRPGPAMLLIHQCNMDRSAWDGLTEKLVGAGIHVLSMDLRGFGDSPGEPFSRETFGDLMAKSPGDLDAAHAFLVAQDGVDGSRVGVGGASCGAMLTADMAGRHAGITTLMVLSGPPSEGAMAHIANTPGLAVFGAATESDTVTPGVGATIQKAVDGSKNPHSIAKIYAGTEHGLPMFAKNPELEPLIIEWLTARLSK